MMLPRFIIVIVIIVTQLEYWLVSFLVACGLWSTN